MTTINTDNIADFYLYFTELFQELPVLSMLLTKQSSSSVFLNKGPFPSQIEVCFTPVSCGKFTSSILFHLISALEGWDIPEFGELNA